MSLSAIYAPNNSRAGEIRGRLSDAAADLCGRSAVAGSGAVNVHSAGVTALKLLIAGLRAGRY